MRIGILKIKGLTTLQVERQDRNVMIVQKKAERCSGWHVTTGKIFAWLTFLVVEAYQEVQQEHQKCVSLHCR
jgi:hypothetical protein